MIRQLLGVSFLIAISSCNPSHYVKYDIKLEKISGHCNGIDPSTNAEINIIGERYVFETCLDTSGKYECKVENKNDTLRVVFIRNEGPKATYRVTLDVQTKPPYKWAEIDGSVLRVNISR